MINLLRCAHTRRSRDYKRVTRRVWRRAASSLARATSRSDIHVSVLGIATRCESGCVGLPGVRHPRLNSSHRYAVKSAPEVLPFFSQLRQSVVFRINEEWCGLGLERSTDLPDGDEVDRDDLLRALTIQVSGLARMR